MQGDKSPANVHSAKMLSGKRVKSELILFYFFCCTVECMKRLRDIDGKPFI